jgi:hypothetical protein
MINNHFNIPVYCKYDAFQQYELRQLYDSFLNLKNKNLLKNFNGTSLLTYNTNINSVLEYFNLNHIKEKIRLYCNDYLINCGVTFSRVEVDSDWLIGYNKNEYQGEHHHGYNDNSISGVLYACVPANSSPIIFMPPNPYSQHLTLKKSQSIYYNPEEGMLLIFPSFLKHKVLPNLDIPDNALRLGLSFNAVVF